MFIPRSCVLQTLYTSNQCGARRQNAKIDFFLCQNQIKVFFVKCVELVYNELENIFNKFTKKNKLHINKITKKKKQKLQMALFNEKNINKSKWTNKCNCFDKEAPKNCNKVISHDYALLYDQLMNNPLDIH